MACEASRVLESLDLLVIFQLRLLDIPICVDEAIIFADFTGYIHTFLVVKLHLFADQVCSCEGFFENENRLSAKNFSKDATNLESG